MDKTRIKNILKKIWRRGGGCYDQLVNRRSLQFIKERDIAALSNAAFIELGFQLILNRPPDKIGMNYYLPLLDNGKLSRHDFIRLLMESREIRLQADHFNELSNEDWVKVCFQMILDRSADQNGISYYLEQLDKGELSRRDLIHLLIESEEYHRSRINILTCIHKVRLEMVQTLLPPAEVILDLGGASPSYQEGSLYGMGYPHQSKKLMILDLPPDIRLLKASEKHKVITDYPKCQSIEYHYASMTNLSFVPDGSVDMVWSGESIEHITESEADQCIREVKRVLKPSGYFCLDTPNHNISQYENPGSLIHPEHKIEYTPSQLSEKIRNLGFEILETKGILPMPMTFLGKYFDKLEMNRNQIISDDADHSYIFFLKCRKPLN